MGETIDIAANNKISILLAEAKNIQEVTHIIRIAYNCNLVDILHKALSSLQEMTVDSSDFVMVATSCFELANIFNYGDIRKIDTTPLKPFITQLFLRSSLLLESSSSCDNEHAKEIISSMNIINMVSNENYDLVDNKSWIDNLINLAFNDSKNSIVCGYAFSILLERNEINDDECSREVSKRLSPSIPADICAGWFEGLAKRNRYALLSRRILWQELDNYISNLEDEDFYRSVIYLRRAFSDFESHEKNGLIDLLSEFWDISPMDVGEEILDDLTDDEEDKLSELNDFDFGDLI